MVKNLKYKILFLFLLFSTFITFNFAIDDGILRQTITGPYEIPIAKEEITFFAGKEESQTFVELHNRYQDFGEKYDNGDLGIIREPYCRYGGTYSINIFLDPQVRDFFNETETLYYCKTTLDFIKSLKMPQSWQNKDLLLYCNDGNLINFRNQNLDFLTTKLNNYKVCVLKNLNLTSNNTIVYGLEVGNFYVDNSPDYFFNTANKNQLTNDFETLSSDFKDESEVAENTFILEYRKFEGKYGINPQTGELCRINYVQKDVNGDGDFYYNNINKDAEIDYSNCIGDIVYDYFVKEINSEYSEFEVETTSYETYILTNTSALSQIAEQIGFTVKVNEFEILERLGISSTPKIRIKFNYNVTSNNTFNKYKEGFNLKYDEYNRVYSLTNSEEALDSDVLNSFNNIPSDFGLSRIALFKNLNNKQIYGYDGVAKMEVTNAESSLKPVYKIKFVDFPSIKDLCLKSLAHYEANDNLIFGFDDKVKCKDNEIMINSLSIDNKDGNGQGLKLFKNIILNLVS